LSGAKPIKIRCNDAGLPPQLRRRGEEAISASRQRKHERGIWQRRYWEHTIHDEADFTNHIDYVHFNPVKHGHVEHAAAWPYSSFHRFVRLGLYPAGWATDRTAPEGGRGER
jgi:putative transposase